MILVGWFKMEVSHQHETGPGRDRKDDSRTAWDDAGVGWRGSEQGIKVARREGFRGKAARAGDPGGR